MTDLIWLGQRLTEAGRAEVAENAPGVPVADLIVMGDLMKNSPSSITDIAARTGYAQSRVSTAVTSIVTRGWAVTEADPDDGRRTIVLVPEPTRTQAQQYQREMQSRALDRLLAKVPSHRKKAVASALDELLTAFRA